MRDRAFTEVTSLSAISHLLAHAPHRIQRLFLPDAGRHGSPRLRELHAAARRAGVAIDTGGGKGREEVRAFVAPYEYADFSQLVSRLGSAPKAKVLVLDHLQDPQNFGALCRSAEALGVGALVLPKDRSVAVTAGVYQASVGAVETLPITTVANVGDALSKLKEAGFWCVGASLEPEAKHPWEMPDFERVALVLGAEGEGLSPRVAKVCDWLTRIPILGKVESLNVSVAGALLLYELERRRHATR